MTKASLLKRIACIAVFVAIAPQPAVAQEDTIFLGIELSLGMDKSTVLGELRRLYTVSDTSIPGPEYTVVSKEGPPFIFHGFVAFDLNNKLDMIQKNWHLTAETDTEHAIAVFGVFSNLVQHSHSELAPSGRIATGEQSVPEGSSSDGESIGSLEMLEAVFFCGQQRVITISYTKTDQLSSASIYERLGSP